MNTIYKSEANRKTHYPQSVKSKVSISVAKAISSKTEDMSICGVFTENSFVNISK